MGRATAHAWINNAVQHRSRNVPWNLLFTQFIKCHHVTASRVSLLKLRRGDTVSVALRPLRGPLSVQPPDVTWVHTELTGESKTCPSATLYAINPTWTAPRANPGLCGEQPVIDSMSYGIAKTVLRQIIPEKSLHNCHINESRILNENLTSVQSKCRQMKSAEHV
jgi:hypothetical protein